MLKRKRKARCVKPGSKRTMRTLTADKVKDVLQLHILLLSAERCWAYAMELRDLVRRAQPAVLTGVE